VHVDLVRSSQHAKATHMDQVALGAAGHAAEVNFFSGLQGAAKSATGGLANAAKAENHAVPINGFAARRIGEHLGHLASDADHHTSDLAGVLSLPQQRRFRRTGDVGSIQLQGAFLAAPPHGAALPTGGCPA
jgi:hypothetical protein